MFETYIGRHRLAREAEYPATRLSPPSDQPLNNAKRTVALPIITLPGPGSPGLSILTSEEVRPPA